MQLAAGLTALSRCATPHKGVTSKRVAKSHNIIRSSCVQYRCGNRIGHGVGALPVVSLLFIESERSRLRGGQTQIRNTTAAAIQPHAGAYFHPMDTPMQIATTRPHAAATAARAAMGPSRPSVLT
jgi:hypothetical protein